MKWGSQTARRQAGQGQCDAIARRQFLRLAGGAAAGAALSGCASIERAFVPAAEPWPRWEAHDPRSNVAVDHGEWNRFLATYVARDDTGLNRVAYRRVTPADRAALGGYIEQLGIMPVGRLNRAEQFAYWANLYNALTVDVILAHYPVRSIFDISISTGWLSFGPWDKKLVAVADEMLSLNDIENRILRPIWRDPRVHYAVNCASVGCPNLRREAFSGARLDAQLTAAARDYVNHPRGVTLAEGRLKVSSIYVWFREDFGGSDEAVLGHLRAYAAPELVAALATVKSIDDNDYDWSLNEQA